ncbi:MAG: DUF2784 domain-containing protein [Xanthomonadales bacterium]|nr:DUF2784 domain-containing protein [Xanthomonadales bacterium]
MSISALGADLVMLVHLAFVLFVVLGGLLVLRWPRVALAHLPALAWGIWIELSGGICPLTPLENMLRRAAGQAGYEGGFIAHYLAPVLYPAWLDERAQFLLAGGLLICNVVIYTLVLRRWRSARQSPADS